MSNLTLTQELALKRLRAITQELDEMGITELFPDARGKTAAQHLQAVIQHLDQARWALTEDPVTADALDYVKVTS